MKAQFVNETIEFKRGQTIHAALDIGYRKEMPEILKELYSEAQSLAGFADLNFTWKRIMPAHYDVPNPEKLNANPLYVLEFGYDPGTGFSEDSDKSAYGEVFIDPIALKIGGRIESEEGEESKKTAEIVFRSIPNNEVITMAKEAVTIQEQLLKKLNIQLEEI